MPMIRAMRLLNAIEAGTTTGAQLEALLTDAANGPGRLAELNVLLGMRGQARRASISLTTMKAVLESPAAVKQFFSSTVASAAAAGVDSKLNSAALVANMAATAASASAVSAIAESGVAMDAVIASPAATASITASDPAMAAIAASNVAMAKVATSDAFIASVIASTPAMTSVAASSSAMTTLCAVPSFRSGVVDSSAAKNTIVASSAALGPVLAARATDLVFTRTVVAASPMAFAELYDFPSRTLPLSSNWESLAYGNGLFVAISTSSSNTMALSSPDGITWTQRTLPSSNWKAVAFGGGLFVAIGTNMAGATSSDGMTWTGRTFPTTFNGPVGYGNGLFVAPVPSTTTVYTSPDGITWTARSLGGGAATWGTVAYGNGTFVVATGSSSPVRTSTDGITWVVRSGNALASMTFGKGLFVGVRGSFCYTSPDGITWTERSLGSGAASWVSVTFGGDLFVAVSSSSKIVATSPDGIIWTEKSLQSVSIGKAVAYGDGIFAIVGNSWAATSF